MGVRYYLKRRRGSTQSDPAPVVLSVFWDEKTRALLTTPHRIAPKDWSKSKRRALKTAPGAAEVNGALDRLANFAASLQSDGHTVEEVRAAVRARLGKAPAAPVAPRLVGAFDRWTDRKRPMLRPGTLQTYSALRGHLLAIYGDGATVEEVGGAFLDDLARDLSARGLTNTTVNKLLKCARGFAEWIGDEYGVSVKAKVKALATANNAPLYLTRDELGRLVEVDLSAYPPGYGAARDLFIAEAVTGQRYGDILAMTWAQIDRDTWTWHLSSEKTAMTVHVPIAAPLRRILDAREGERTPLPVLSNQKANKYLKEVCRLAKIDAPVSTQSLRGGERIAQTRPKHDAVTTHAARRTFVTLFLQGGGAITELIGLTHDDLDTLRRYAGHSDDERRAHIGRTFDAL